MSTDNKAHNFIIAAIFFEIWDCVGIPLKQKHSLLPQTGFLRWDSSVKRWDCCASRRDSILKGLGFIFPQFYHWDFTVPEVNIYYY
jgi:hypothetical protein